MAGSPSRSLTRVAAVVAIAGVLAIAAFFSTDNTQVNPAGVTPQTTAEGSVAAERACSDFTQLVNDLQAGNVATGQVVGRLGQIASDAADAAASDAATWGHLAADTHALQQAVQANDPSADQIAQAVTADCRGIGPSGATGT